jgi:hypothetical protein
MSADFGAYVLFNEGQPFHHIILLEGNYSPVLTFEQKHSTSHTDLPVQLFVGYGTQSSACRQLLANLTQRHYKNLRLYEVQLQNKEHFSIAAEGFTLGLKAVYKKELARLKQATKMNEIWGLVGTATKNGWEGPDIKLERDKNTGGIWFLNNVQLTGGEMKFRVNNDWSINLGIDADGKLKYSGENIKVKAGIYAIRLDVTDEENPTYAITVMK